MPLKAAALCLAVNAEDELAAIKRAEEEGGVALVEGLD